MRIGFVGAGNMGGAVARRLATGGHDVRVADPNPEATRRCAEAGATVVADAAEAATHADAVFTSLPTPDVVEHVWGSITPHLTRESIGVDVSTIDPATADRLHHVLAEDGIRFVHCALSKTPAAAETGEIPLFAGGSDTAVDEVQPLLDRIGERTYRFATPGEAATFKLISNLIGMTNVAVLAEGLAMAHRAGIDPELLASALNDTGARSFQSEVRLPWMIDGDDTARFGVHLAAKDLRLAVDSAARTGVPTPLGGQTLAQLLAAMRHGFGDEDVVAVRKLLSG